MSGEPGCPLCASPLYGWLVLPPASVGVSIGMPVDPGPEGERVLERCESCGAGVEQGTQVDLAGEWRALVEASPPSRVRAPNRASMQAVIGGVGWAALDRSPGRLLLAPRALELLAERNGARLDGVGFPPAGRSQLWMWQTLLNALTFHANFAREVRAGRLRPATARNRFAFFADCVATVLAAPLVALVSIPLEAVAALIRRGGELEARRAADVGE